MFEAKYHIHTAFAKAASALCKSNRKPKVLDSSLLSLTKPDGQESQLDRLLPSLVVRGGNFANISLGTSLAAEAKVPWYSLIVTICREELLLSVPKN